MNRTVSMVAERFALAASADVLVVGGGCSLLVPVLDVLDGCGWTVRYRAGVDAAVEWLKDKNTHVALVAVDEIWRDLVARLQTSANCGRIILASQGYLPIAEVLSAGVHYTLRVPLNAYDLRWTVVTACREARSEAEQSRSFQ